MNLQPLIDFFETLDEATLPRIAGFYTDDAWFKDPFNEVRGTAAIEGIFRHMFTQVEAPRFFVTECFAEACGAMLVWEFHFRRGDSRRRIRGVSHLRLAADGRVSHHRDYWDAAEELYMQLPLVGGLMRWLRRRLAAP